jgi:hypothetical protein
VLLRRKKGLRMAVSLVSGLQNYLSCAFKDTWCARTCQRGVRGVGSSNLRRPDHSIQSSDSRVSQKPREINPEGGNSRKDTSTVRRLPVRAALGLPA